MINCRKSSIRIPLLFYLAYNSFSEPPLKKKLSWFGKNKAEVKIELQQFH